MKIEIDIISREMVTPSSPTPSHLRNYKLSFIDQLMPPVLTPHIFFYPPNETLISNSERSNHLKKSLSGVLTLFYPLAGRIVGNSYVNCNDEGVMYVEARANCKIRDVINNLKPEEFSILVPCDPYEETDLCLFLQVTFFNCGGVAIGIGSSHKITDGSSFFMFINSWAATSRGDDRIESPVFEAAALFPPKDSGNKNPFKKENKENIVTKRFVFTSPKISELKDKYTKNEMRPTRVETLTAFIWTRLMVVTGIKDDVTKVRPIMTTVNIRKRVVPPLSEYHFGNIIIRAIATPSLENDEDGTHGVIKKLRDAIRGVDSEFIAKFLETGESRKEVKDDDDQVKSNDEAEIFKFASLCRMPLHKADFGWGIPFWVGSAKIPASNLVFFMDSLCEGDIDAWVSLKIEDMVKLEKDEEFHKCIGCLDDVIKK